MGAEIDRQGQPAQSEEASWAKLCTVLWQNTREDGVQASVEVACRDCYSSLINGLRAWGRREGIRKVMLGLSGGLDSALVAALATEAFGAGNVLTVFMPSEYTSEMSREDAGTLAKNLGVEMLTLPIDGLRQEAARVIEAAHVGGNEGLWAENVQARLRAVLAMAVSNRRGHVLLNTSNRSEILVGYSTLYGDSCGALSVLGDLYKTEIRILAVSFNMWKAGELIPERIIYRPPSAELRANQKDEDSLPNYVELDKTLAAIMGEFPGSYNETVLRENEGTRRAAVSLMERNAFKRRQLAPVLPVYGRKIP